MLTVCQRASPDSARRAFAGVTHDAGGGLQVTRFASGQPDVELDRATAVTCNGLGNDRLDAFALVGRHALCPDGSISTPLS